MAEFELVGQRQGLAATEVFGHVDVDDLCDDLKTLRDSLAPVVAEATTGLSLQTVEIGLTLSASGKIAFIAEAGVEASITLTFGRGR